MNGGGGWGIFKSILGWTNSATYGSVISYNFYWLAVIVGFGLMRYKEVKGHLPFRKAKADDSNDYSSPTTSAIFEAKSSEEKSAVQAVTIPTKTIS
jgi:high-affinity iron transporter